MRFANIGSSLIAIGLSSLFSAVLSPPAFSGDIWRIGGQNVLELPSADHTRQAEQRLADLLDSLDPAQSWTVDVVLPPPPTATPPASPPPKPRLAILRLNGQILLEVREADASALGAPSVVELATSWARSLNNLFSQPAVRQFLVVTNRMPAQITYQGRPYTISGRIAPDRGLFRTNGRKIEGRVIFWEIPADNKTYQVSPTPLPEPNQPAVVYLLHKRLFFVPYQRS